MSEQRPCTIERAPNLELRHLPESESLGAPSATRQHHSRASRQLSQPDVPGRRSGKLSRRWHLLALGLVAGGSLPAAHASPAVAAPISSAAPSAEPPCTPAAGVLPVPFAVTIQDGTGAAIPGARVTLTCGAQVLSVETDRTGVANLNLRPAAYRLAAAAPGFATAERTVTVTDSARTVSIPLTIGSAGDVVNVSADSGFVPFATNFGSKTGSDLVEVPQTINFISQHEMEVRNTQTVNEVLRYTPGIETDEYGVELRQDWMLVRGFSADGVGIFRDGMRWDSLAGKVDPYELQSVEVIKGPSSVLYGQAPPGGLVNLTTKRPSAERSGTLEAQFGSYDRRQIQGDFTGAFDHNQIFRYRLLGLFRASDTQTNYVPDDRRLIAPELAWQPSDRTNLTLLGDWQHDQTKWSQFLPAEGTLYPNPNGQIPVYSFAGEPGQEGVYREEASVGYLADHTLGDGWQLHQNYRYQYSNFQGTTYYGIGFDPSSTTLLDRTGFTYPQYTYIHTLDSRALRRFSTTNWENTVLAGFDFSDEAQRTTGGVAAIAPINIYNPVYGATPGAYNFYENQFTDAPQYGTYLQDQIKYKQHLLFTLGGREDWAVEDLINYLPGTTGQHQNNSKFTGRAGVTYLTSIGIDPYYSFATSFQPTSGTDFSSNLFRPTYGEQHEAGVKIQPRTWNSFITASFFNITQNNTLTTDPNHPYYSVQGGAARSRGVELEVVSQLREGVSLHSGYSLVSTAYTQASSAEATEIGNWFPQVPRHQFSFLGDYAVPHGRFAGLGGNFGVRFIGDSFGDSANTLLIPNYTLLDGALRFNYRRTEFAVNATNLTNRSYIATCTGAAYCGYGFQRNVIGDVKYHF